jgi:hypothetical protein
MSSTYIKMRIDWESPSRVSGRRWRARRRRMERDPVGRMPVGSAPRAEDDSSMPARTHAAHGPWHALGPAHGAAARVLRVLFYMYVKAARDWRAGGRCGQTRAALQTDCRARCGDGLCALRLIMRGDRIRKSRLSAAERRRGCSAAREAGYPAVGRWTARRRHCRRGRSSRDRKTGRGPRLCPPPPRPRHCRRGLAFRGPTNNGLAAHPRFRPHSIPRGCAGRARTRC